MIFRAAAEKLGHHHQTEDSVSRRSVVATARANIMAVAATTAVAASPAPSSPAAPVQGTSIH